MAKADTDTKVQEAAKDSKKKPDAGKAGEKSQKAQAQAVSKGPGGLVGKARDFKEFFEESKVEMKKVTWPTRKETLTTSVAVLVLVVIMSLFLGIVDLGLTKIVEFILS